MTEYYLVRVPKEALERDGIAQIMLRREGIEVSYRKETALIQDVICETDTGYQSASTEHPAG